MSNAKKKVLLMGKSGSGKSSMRGVIFSNQLARDTHRLGATIDVEHSNVRFLGSMVLNLWDCGGQEGFLNNYVSSQRTQIFTNVAILIYVFDGTTPSGSAEWEKDIRYYEECLSSLRENSDDANVWVLINKMDLVSRDRAERDRMFEDKRAELEKRSNAVQVDGKEVKPIRCFATSIYDESLYKAWSSVIHTLVPNASLMQSHLTHLCKMLSCTEAVLFESQTFLVLAKSGSDLDCDETELEEYERLGGAVGFNRKRFEKISEIVKEFRHTCRRTMEPFVNWEMRLPQACIALDALTPNTYLMLVSTEPWVEPHLLMLNIDQARSHFDELAKPVVKTRCPICREHEACKYEGDDAKASPQDFWQEVTA